MVDGFIRIVVVVGRKICDSGLPILLYTTPPVTVAVAVGVFGSRVNDGSILREVVVSRTVRIRCSAVDCKTLPTFVIRSLLSEEGRRIFVVVLIGVVAVAVAVVRSFSVG